MKLKKGKLLIATPSILSDSMFSRAIIFLTEHNNNNSVGFIINKPLNYYLKDLLPDIDCNFTIYEGGPVEQDNLYFIHKVPKLIPDSIEVSNGIYWGGNFVALKQLLQNNLIKSSEIRFFLGYTGWTKIQLPEELATKSWFVAKSDSKLIFSEFTKDLWRKKILEKGGDYKLWANAPNNFNLN